MIPSSAKPQLTKPDALPKTKLMWIAGASGGGKTHLMATVGKGNKALIIDTEGGSVTYRSPAFLNDPAATEPDNIDILDLSRVTDLKDLVFQVDSTLDYLIRSRNSDGYSVVAFDSLTEFQAKFINLHQAPDPRQSYGALNQTVYGFITKAKQLPVSMVFTSLLTFKEDEVLSREVVRPAVSPGLWQLAGQVHAVGFYELRQQGAREVRTLNFEHRMRLPGKNRGIVEATYQDPSMQELLSFDPAEAPVAAPAAPKFGKPRASAGGK